MGAEQTKEKESGGFKELSDEELSFLVKNTSHTVQGVRVSFYQEIFRNIAKLTSSWQLQ